MKKEAIFQDEEVLRLIPQRAPIVLVDKFYGIEDNRSYAGFTIPENHLFCESGQLQEAGIIEHIAQSAAARIGYLYYQKGEKTPLGFIGSIDKLTIHQLPEAGKELLTEISIIQEVFDITLIAAQVKVEEQPVAECRMKIFIKKEEDETQE